MRLAFPLALLVACAANASTQTFSREKTAEPLEDSSLNAGDAATESSPERQTDGGQAPEYFYADDRGQVLTEVMYAAVRAQGKKFTACMVNEQGSATFEVIIAADGSVLRAQPFRTSIRDEKMKCLIAAWRTARFPPPLGNAPARAVIPLVFK